MKHIDEIERIIGVATEYGVDPYFIMAIREQENGAAGREFGVLSVSAANDWPSQCHACCATVRGHVARWGSNPFVVASGPNFKRLVYTPAFVTAFAGAWAPLGAANDPTHLNEDWLPGVTAIYAELVATAAAPD